VIAQESPSSLQFIFPSCPVAERGPYGASLLYEDESLDIAVLKTGAPQPPLSIATDYHFRRGHEVTVIGNPGAFDGQILQNAVSRGIMSTEATIDGQPYYQLGIAINPGNSGGPVFDEYANVIGIVTLKDANKEGIGFCIPLFKLREVLDRVDKLTPRQVELAGSFHRTKLVFLSLRSLGQAYSEIVSMWVTEMKSAQERDKITQRFANPAGRKRGAAAMEQDQGRSFALQADKDFKERIRKVLAKVDTGMFTNLDAEIDKVINDPVLKEEVRKQFHDYWNNYVELRQAADEPRGNFEQYFKKFADLEKQRKSVSGALQTTLGVPPLDEER
jgi:S1-C subfamily serine protease